MVFEWDVNKAATNLIKHGISFDEAKTVFDDRLFVDFYEPDHSDDKHRYIIIGMSLQNRLLLVAYTERSDRLISTREATRTERKAYVQG